MPAGLQTFHANGQIKLDLTSRLPKVLGDVYIPYGYFDGQNWLNLPMSGQIVNDELLLGRVFTQYIPRMAGLIINGVELNPDGPGIFATCCFPPAVTVVGNTINWEYQDPGYESGIRALPASSSFSNYPVFYGGGTLVYGIA